MKNFDWCVYTYRHRRAMEYLTDKLIRDEQLRMEMKKRIAFHDMDKVLLYQVLDQNTAQDIHVENQPHHVACKKEKTYLDLVETVIDYESAPYTKPDKPLNAFDFVNKILKEGKISQETANVLFDIMQKFGIAHSGTVEADIDGLEYLRNQSAVTEEMILQEIIEYVKTI